MGGVLNRKKRRDNEDGEKNTVTIIGYDGTIAAGDIFAVYFDDYPMTYKAIDTAENNDGSIAINVTRDGTQDAVLNFSYSGTAEADLEYFVPAETTTYYVRDTSKGASAPIQLFSVEPQGIDYDKGNKELTATHQVKLDGVNIGSVTVLLSNINVEHDDKYNIISTYAKLMLSDIATAYKDLNKVIPAVKLCMFLGSTAGMFPMVIDLYNDLNRSRYDQVKAAYFIANYYIIEKEPELYDTIMSLDDGRIHSRSYVWEKFTDDAFDYQSALEAAEQSGDPIIENWARFINSGRMADVDEVDSSLLWRNIASYATILRFAKSINVNDTIVALIDYLQSEGQAPATTGISVSCPVRVNIYDMDDNLVASLSSEDDEIADCEYGTMYLLGENGETKYFQLNSEDYRIEIVPYADGTMDVSITNSNEDGTAEGVYYEDVELRTGMTITTDSLVEDGASLEVNEGEMSSSITPEDEIPVTGISVDTLSQLAVGESVTLRATIAPETATDKTLTWTSSNPGIIEVSSDGIITAMSAGNATITATGANGVSASVDISAYTPAQSVSLDVQSLTMCVGEEYSLTASVEPSNTTHPIKWYSSAGSVAVVDENGCITALSEGMAVLTANIDGVSASVTVTVSESPVEIILYQSDTNGDRIKVDMLNNSLYSNYTGSVFISLYDANGRMLSTSELPLALSAGTHMTGYIPITNWDGHSELTAKAFTIDGQMLPVSSSTEINIIG